MSSVDEVRRQLVESELMTAESADEQIARWREGVPSGDPSDGDALLAWLADEKAITSFQADALRAGYEGPFMVGPYRIGDRAAVGRLGNTYRAVHTQFDHPVSLKVFPSTLQEDPEKLARMDREIRAAAELDDPHVVRTFQLGHVGETYYLVFEDLPGETLQDLLAREGAVPEATACRLIRDAAQGLACFHDKFLVHRDVCPANMWISEAGPLKVMEMGAVRTTLSGLDGSPDSSVTTDGTVLGNYDYMAPEQAQSAHAADHRSDIYSLGCVLYHCLTGHPPFVEKNPVRLAMRHASESPQPVAELVADIPAELSAAIDTMLAKSPEDRFQSMEDVIRELEAFAEPSEGEEPPPMEFLAWLQEPEPVKDGEAGEAALSESATFLAWLAGRH